MRSCSPLCSRDKRGTEAPEKIVVSTSRIANLADGFRGRGGESRAEEELQGLIENYVRDEVFYRAGRAAGLIAMMSSSAAACGKKWSFWPKIFRSPNLPKASLRPFSLPIRIVSGRKTDFRFIMCFSVHRAAPIPSIRI